MSTLDRITDGITEHSKVIIVVMLILTAALGAGATQVSSDSGLSQFESDSPEAAAQDYIGENFTTGNDTQFVQVIVRSEDENGNVLTKQSLIHSIEYQQSVRANSTLNDTLIEENAIFGVSNIVALTAMQQETAAELQQTGAELQQRQQQLEQDQQALQQQQAELENRSADLNQTVELLRGGLTDLRENPNRSVRAEFDEVAGQAPVSLEGKFDTFNQAASQLRNAENEDQVEQAYQLGTQGVLQSEFQALQQQGEELKQQGQELQERGEQLQADSEAFQQQRASLQSSGAPTLAEQKEQLQSMNASEVEDVLTVVLSDSDGENGGSPFAGQALQLMPTSYETGSTTADARMMVVQQKVETSSDMQSPESVSDGSIEAQLEMQDLAQEASSDGDEYIVFGFGVISQEINQSMEDSLAIVGPLALLFVLVTLLVAYRDLLDIVLGLVGIGAALAWTFGAMGYLDISFNQIMIAVPVLLIGLSIDYAIHIFMRHREERLDDNTPSDVRGSMQYALAGVGIALVWVTATTVIGFMSNLTSPLSAIADFGIVSSWGIVAALVIFGAFIPALKVEADEILEGFGFDRKKRAFGTGGGYFSQVLKVGSTLAKKAPIAVIVIALLLSAGGAYGATQVSTSFAQEDFIADEPPAWMYDLPEQLRPGEYSAKQNLDYVNDNFQREDSQAQILLRSDATDPETLHAIAAAKQNIDDGEYDTPFAGATGEVNVRSVLTVMERTAATNESFNQSFTAADTDGDGVPEENVTQLYDSLFEVDEQAAADIVYRTDDGEYVATRLVVPIKGDASTSDVTTQMRQIESNIQDDASLDDEAVIATGSPIINEIVQQDLLNTVIQSLIITLIAVFLFLMIAYRITEGSATLGIVTLLPVALSVAWILGTMYLIEMPFNVLTGMITSLTVGLGVAYSIHVSERFNLELERRETKWEAMDRTITGTGGALLGSAATTVGGFGVLSFAIFPALQQFGIITALTIIYAFLASVLVLPSLLVVWHRYAGPETTDVDDDSTAPPATTTTDSQPATTSDASVPATTDAETTAPATTGAETTAPATTGDDWTSLGDSGAASASSPTATAAAAGGSATAAEPPIRMTRTVSDETPDRGDEFTVTLSATDVSGRVVLTERVPGTGGEVSELTPSPTSYSMVGRTLYVLWDLEDETDLTLTYFAGVPTDASAGEKLSLDGKVRTRDGEGIVDGPSDLTVTTPFLAEALSGPLTKSTLDRASEKAQAGELTEDELDYLYERWLGEAESTETPPYSDGGDVEK
ncbi:MMPL family transporter [Haloarchaeobius sp. DFWS5]|uniref:MMPL family transporter n=1 Tax=Haloarchaeobius sp. DFWS5 TaxID=3446114 RepID=UPI003EBB8F77